MDKDEKFQIRNEIKKEMYDIIQQERNKLNEFDISKLENEFLNMLDNTKQNKDGYAACILFTHFLHYYLSKLDNLKVSYSNETLVEIFKNINLKCTEIYTNKYDKK